MRDTVALFGKMPPATEAKELVFKEPRCGYPNLDAEFKSFGCTWWTASFFYATEAQRASHPRPGGRSCCLFSPLMLKPKPFPKGKANSRGSRSREQRKERISWLSTPCPSRSGQWPRLDCLHQDTHTHTQRIYYKEWLVWFGRLTGPTTCGVSW